MDRISPRVDISFKKIFGVEENKDLLISLINSIVGTEDQDRDVTLLNPYKPKNFREDKLSISQSSRDAKPRDSPKDSFTSTVQGGLKKSWDSDETICSSM